MEFFQFELPNGIRCIHRPSKSMVSYCGLTINTGSRDELPGEHGMAHFLEHAIFKGTRRRKAFQINSRLENLGGELNAFTTKEETVVHATALKRDFAKAAELIADIVFNPTFPQKELNREKEVIFDEINSYKDSPAERIYDDFEDRIFAGSSLGHNILGNKRAVSKYDTSDALHFHRRTYNTDQMVFSSVGAMGIKRFRDVCERSFGSIAANPRSFSREESKENPVFTVSKRHSTFQAHCVLGARAYSNKDPRRLPFALLVNMLGGMSSNSLLNIALREKNGFSYNIEANYTPFSDTGIMSIYFGTDKDKVDFCFELIYNEIKKVILGKITPRQFSRMKKQFIGQLHISMESNEGNMLSAGKSLLVYNKVEETAQIVKRIEKLTLTQLIEVGKEIYQQPLSSLVYQ